MQQPVHDLPDRLALPLSSGEPWWYWLGGRPALDLVNTLRERWRRRVETLVPPADLERWLVEAGVMEAESGVAATPDVLAEARALREAIDACVTALLEGAPSPPAAVKRIDGWLKYAGARPALLLDEHGLPLLGERGGVRVWASDTCSARFYDRSPAGRRRWCSMRTCGNEAKARRHRAKVRSAA